MLSSEVLKAPIISVELNGFVLTERVHEPNNSVPHHSHELTSIGLIIEGSYLETIGRRAQVCTPETIQVLPAGEEHSFDFGRVGVHCLTIDVKPQKLKALRPFSTILDKAVQLQEIRLTAFITRLHKEMRLLDDASFLFIEAMLLELLGDVERRRARDNSLSQPRWLRQAKDMIHASFAEKMTLLDIASAIGVHPTYLAQTFRKHYKCTVGEYVRRRRLEYATEQLIGSNNSLAEIALSAGFYDQSHFSHAFKLYTGMTPAEFRAARKLI